MFTSDGVTYSAVWGVCCVGEYGVNLGKILKTFVLTFGQGLFVTKIVWQPIR